jgi:hypothetical protein
MAQCIEQVFKIIAPDRIDIPGKNETTDCMINLQAFLLNTYGAIDNLAWVLVSEKRIIQQDGAPLHPSWVGLRQVNTVVRSALSPELRARLEEFDQWFDYLENYRHALAHRIPPYVPPFIVNESRTEEYHELQRRMGEAMRRRDMDEYDRLEHQELKLVFFRPWMGHSPGEQRGTVAFHEQILRDFATVEDLGWKVLAELDRDPHRVPVATITAKGDIRPI